MTVSGTLPAGGVEQHQRRQVIDERGAEVTLEHQQNQTRRRKEQRGHHLPYRSVRAEKIRQHQHDGELDDFAGLKRTDERNIHPVFCAVVPFAECQRQNKRDDAQHHTQHRQPAEMPHMKDQFAHDEHDRQPCGVENGLLGSSCRRYGIQHHDAHAAKEIRQSHDQRVDGKQPRQGERRQQTQRRDQQADFHRLRVYCALCPECTEQQTQNFKCRGQQRNQGHPCVARAAEGAPPVLGDCRDMLFFPLLPPLLRRIFFRKGFVFPRRSALRRLVRRGSFFFCSSFCGRLCSAFGRFRFDADRAFLRPAQAYRPRPLRRRAPASLFPPLSAPCLHLRVFFMFSSVSFFCLARRFFSRRISPRPGAPKPSPLPCSALLRRARVT